MQPTIRPVSVILKEELMRRKNRNPSYSLRAFAKDIGLSSSFVSKVISGKKNVSEESLLKISHRLKLDNFSLDELTFHCSKQKNSVEFEEINLDVFQAICDWEHFALLEAVTLKSKNITIADLADLFSTSEDKMSQFVERLVKLELLIKNSDGCITSTGKNFTTAGQKIPKFANTEHERQLLKKAIECLDTVSFENRSQSSMTMAIPSHRINEAKEKIRQFNRDMMKLLQRPGDSDSVYNLSISFFPLTQLPNKINNEPLTK